MMRIHHVTNNICTAISVFNNSYGSCTETQGHSYAYVRSLSDVGKQGCDSLLPGLPHLQSKRLLFCYKFHRDHEYLPLEMGPKVWLVPGSQQLQAHQQVNCAAKISLNKTYWSISMLLHTFRFCAMTGTGPGMLLLAADQPHVVQAKLAACFPKHSLAVFVWSGKVKTAYTAL